MAILVVIVLLGLSVWTIISTFKRLRRHQCGKGWWSAFYLLSITGIVADCYCAFCVEYHWSPKLKVAGFPMPLVVFQLEEDRWTDFPLNEVAMYSGLLANILSITAIAIAPILITSLLTHRKSSA